MAETSDEIVANALKPRRVNADGVAVEQHSIDDQIKALEYAKAQAAGQSRKLPIRFAKIVAPGAI